MDVIPGILCSLATSYKQICHLIITELWGLRESVIDWLELSCWMQSARGCRCSSPLLHLSSLAGNDLLSDLWQTCLECSCGDGYVCWTSCVMVTDECPSCYSPSSVKTLTETQSMYTLHTQNDHPLDFIFFLIHQQTVRKESLCKMWAFHTLWVSK